jgi:hypothetical protein
MDADSIAVGYGMYQLTMRMILIAELALADLSGERPDFTAFEQGYAADSDRLYGHEYRRAWCKLHPLLVPHAYLTLVSPTPG